MADDVGHGGLAASRFLPPGFFWRRIELHAGTDAVVAGLEDDVHRFLIRIEHASGRIKAVQTREQRFPWSSCQHAGSFLASQLIGQDLDQIAALDPYIHCTHLFELAIIAAAHAHAPAMVRYDLQVADPAEGRTTAIIARDGAELLRWQVSGTLIEAPDAWAGRDLRKLSVWRTELAPEQALQAMMLRRVVHISGARRFPQPRQGHAADRGASRMGACFTYQLPRALDSSPMPNWHRDFSRGDQPPLAGFDPGQTLPAEGAHQ